MTEPFQTMQAVARVYVLPRCDISLYADTGNWTKGSLLWTAKQVDNLRVSERWDEVEEYQTGLPYPVTHHFNERHSLTIDSLWQIAMAMARNTEYVLVCTFKDASLSAATRTTVTRTYYGVMLASREIAARDSNELGATTSLNAKHMDEV
jgi:hypothetical protein